MGFMRPMLDPRASLQQRLDMISRDVLLTVASLSSSREGWAPDMTVQRLKGVKSARNLSERFTEVKEKVQMRADTVPLHRLGVRTTSQETRDEVYGRGGYWIAR
jgi:hypothetical protein